MTLREYPTIREIFGSMVFDRRVMKEKLNQDVYDRLVAAMEGRQKLDAGVADTVAMAMRDWAIAHGATHWAHWFHPQTELTAEKHQAFTLAGSEGTPIDVFRGSDLIQGEPDASSFPTQIGRACVGKECRSRWSPYH